MLKAKSAGKNHLCTVNLFITITNANFDREAIIAEIKKTLQVKAELLGQLTDKAQPAGSRPVEREESEFDAKAKLLVSWLPKTKTSVLCGK